MLSQELCGSPLHLAQERFQPSVEYRTLGDRGVEVAHRKHADRSKRGFPASRVADPQLPLRRGETRQQKPRDNVGAGPDCRRVRLWLPPRVGAACGGLAPGDSSQGVFAEGVRVR